MHRSNGVNVKRWRWAPSTTIAYGGRTALNAAPGVEEPPARKVIVEIAGALGYNATRIVIPMPEQALLRRIVRAQRLRHVVANKLTLPLIVLRELQEGRPVEPRVVAQAIRDLEALMASVDKRRQ